MLNGLSSDEIQALSSAYLDDPTTRQQDRMQNYLAAVGIPTDEIVDCYLIHFERLQSERRQEKSV